MTDSTILVTESGSKKLQSYNNTVAGNSVDAEAITLVDSNGIPVGKAGDPTNWADNSVTGNLTAAASTVILDVRGRAGWAVAISGAWSANIQIFVSADNQASYVALGSIFSFATAAWLAGVVTVNGTYTAYGMPGITHVKVKPLTFASGTAVVTIDAGLKMESEATGDISEGVGTAMGGNGTERFRIEEATSKSNTPVLTIVCKMTLKEAISQMPKPVFEKVDYVVGRVLEIIRENTESGNTIVVVGVGNTMGVE